MAGPRSSARPERSVAKLDGDNNIVTEVIHNNNRETEAEAETKRGRSWRHVQVLYVISLFSLGKI